MYERIYIYIYLCVYVYMSLSLRIFRCAMQSSSQSPILIFVTIDLNVYVLLPLRPVRSFFTFQSSVIRARGISAHVSFHLRESRTLSYMILFRKSHADNVAIL